MEIVGVIKGVDQNMADELVKEANTVCLYSKVTMGNIAVTLSATVE